MHSDNAVASEHGMVTAEAAFASVSLSLVVLLLIPVFVVLAAQLRVDDAARVAARSAARGDDDQASSLARASAPESTISISRGGGRVQVNVHQRVGLPIPGLGSVEVSARSVVVDETADQSGLAS